MALRRLRVMWCDQISADQEVLVSVNSLFALVRSIVYMAGIVYDCTNIFVVNAPSLRDVRSGRPEEARDHKSDQIEQSKQGSW